MPCCIIVGGGASPPSPASRSALALEDFGDDLWASSTMSVASLPKIHTRAADSRALEPGRQRSVRQRCINQGTLFQAAGGCAIIANAALTGEFFGILTHIAHQKGSRNNDHEVGADVFNKAADGAVFVNALGVYNGHRDNRQHLQQKHGGNGFNTAKPALPAN
jgi:hypothetical protein